MSASETTIVNFVRLLNKPGIELFCNYQTDRQKSRKHVSEDTNTDVHGSLKQNWDRQKDKKTVKSNNKCSRLLLREKHMYWNT